MNVKSTPELQDAKRELLIDLLEIEGIYLSDAQKIFPRDEGIEPPLSFAQEGLWFLNQLDPYGTAYNLFRAQAVKGSLDIAILKRSLNELAGRHEVLRTSFTSLDGQPVAVVSDHATIELLLVDLRDLPESARLAEAHFLMTRQAREPFELSSCPILRAMLLKLQENDHTLCLTTHHIISDDWSLGIFFRELSMLYEAFSHGKPSPLGKVPLGYTDFAVWQRGVLAGDVLARQLSYWKEHLGASLDMSEFPTDKARPAVLSFHGAREPVRIPHSLAKALKALSNQERATLFITLTAAFNAMLYRYTARQDIVVGFPVTQRSRPELADVMGFFVNTLVLRTDLSGNPTFRELLSRVREAVRKAYRHPELPFDKLVEALQLKRGLSHNPLFQVMFIFQNGPNPKLNLPTLDVTPIEIDGGTAKFDLTASLAEEPEGVLGSFEYSTDLFQKETIQRLVVHFGTLLEAAASDPDRKIAYLPILTEKERHLILAEWNDTKSPYPRDKCLHELFEAQAANTPDAIALAWKDSQLTYRELNLRGNQLAHHLRHLGISPEVPVGVCLERSPELLIGLLGILKAGGAYVPFEPSYPKERLSYMIRDAGISVLLTQNRFPLAAFPFPKIVNLNTDWPLIAGESTEALRTHLSPENLAYVIYTSGSTGKPKGVEILHRALLNLLTSIQNTPGLTEKDALLSVTTLSFDIAALELYLPLLSGATVILSSSEEAMEGKELAAKLRESQASVMQATPSTWRLLLESGWKPEKQLRIFCGGEALPKDLADRLSNHGNPLWNLYGPTETTVWSSVHRVSSKDAPVPIGRPIANTQTYILDAHYEPLPIIVPGELYIGGDGLARGYLGSAELTAERFLPSPYTEQPGARIYRTGDMARYRSDGSMEFLGRNDHQVKVRGHRIELGEIEAVLRQHPLVGDAVVTARNESDKLGAVPTSESLAAYVVAGGSVPTASELRRFLNQRLPAYMLPEVFVFLDALPLTQNGKIDRSALPAPDGTRPGLDKRFLPPRTPTEELLAQIWSEVLNVDSVGVQDDFFEIGGHSLLATRVISRIRNIFRVELPLRSVFEAPTVEGLAAIIDTLVQRGENVETPAIRRVPRGGDLPLSSFQEQLWFLDQLHPGASTYNVPASFRLRGRLDVRALEIGLNEIVKRHETLRTRFRISDGVPTQSIARDWTLPVPIVDLEALRDTDRESASAALAEEEAAHRFDLTRGPLIRVILARLQPEEHVLLVTIHHIVCDAWSMGLFFKELGILYDRLTGNASAPLDALSVQYADFAAWQRDYLKGEVFDSHVEYWRNELKDLPVLELPTDRGRTFDQTFRGRRRSLMLPEELSARLRQLARCEQTTMFMTLLAVLNLLLSRQSGQDDIVIGSTNAGRNRSELENLIGFFINALVLRTRVEANLTFKELLARVRETCLGAHAHQDIPFDRLVQVLQPARDTSRNPLFQVMFNMINVSDTELDLRGLEVRRFVRSELPAKFDLIVYAPAKDQSIELQMVYNTDLFGEARIDSMLRQFEYLLEQVAERPDNFLGSYSLVSPQARPLLPDPTEPLDDTWEGPVHGLFTEQANQNPEHPALVDATSQCSYRDLELKSNQLANYLRAHGIEEEDTVAIWGHRSAFLVAALFGVLKAGAAFSILDPAYPPARVIQYLRMIRPRAWVEVEGARAVSAEIEHELRDFPVSCRLSATDKKLNEFSTDPLDLGVGRDNLAYVALTSGSTGTPKAVLGRHGPMTHFLPWQRETFGLRQSDRFCLISGLSYNLLHRDVFTPLSVGAALYIPDEDTVLDPNRLLVWMKRHRITVLHLTPALGRVLYTAAQSDLLEDLRRVFFAGDLLRKDDVIRFRALAPNARIVSFYGATETQRAVGYFLVPLDLAGLRDQVPLGRGIRDVQLLVLNSSGGLAGIGELGRIHVRSPHLARGYLEDQELTEQRFQTNPFTEKADDRLYKTDELGRYLTDGAVELVGRTELQTNIRGFRVNLSEIELVLKECACASQCAVIARSFILPSGGTDERLLAYVVPGDTPVSVDELRNRLGQKLPHYMVPSHFFFVGSLPLTRHGKVDQEALPLPEEAGQSARDFAAPETPTEKALAAIWTEVLGKERVGVHDSFFDLGGHSLLATMVLARVRERLAADVPLRAFLEKPTLGNLARLVDTPRKERPSDETSRTSQDREEFEL